MTLRARGEPQALFLRTKEVNTWNFISSFLFDPDLTSIRGILITQVPLMWEPQPDLFTIVRWRCFILTLLVNHIKTQNNFLKKQFRFDFFVLQSIQSCGLIVHDQMTEPILAERRQNWFQKTLLYYYHSCRCRCLCGNNRDISTKQLQYDFLQTVVCSIVSR